MKQIVDLMNAIKPQAVETKVIAQAGRPGIGYRAARSADRSPASRPGLLKRCAVVFSITCTGYRARAIKPQAVETKVIAQAGRPGIGYRAARSADRSPASRPGLLQRCAVVFSITCTAAAAQNAQNSGNSLADRAAVSSATQTRIRAETAKVTGDLSRIIDEFDRNGLGDGQDAKMLRGVRDTLSTLTDSQMEKVLALLDQARSAPSDDSAKTRSASAYATQKEVYAAMQQTLLAFQQQADLLDLSVQFAELSKRQNANFKETKHLALRTMNARDLDEGRLAELHVQQTEQDSIQSEVIARLDKLASLMKSVDPAVAAQLSTATQQVTPAGLQIALSGSSSELRQVHMTRAASQELSSYRQLREFSRLARPAREPEQILTDAADELGVTIAGYQVVMDDTIKAHRGETDENRMTIDDEQGDLVDDVSDINKDIEPLAAEAFSTLSSAKEMMQEARAAQLGGTDRQKHTLPVLIAARQQILDELKHRQLTAQMQDGNTKTQQADAVRDELNQLVDKQKQILQQTQKSHSDAETARLAASQAAMTDALKALRPNLAKESPDAAKAVDKASDTSQQANDRLAENKPREARDPQQQTIDALAAAQKQADAVAADLDQKNQDLDKLQQTHDEIAKVANAEQALAVQTAVAAAKDQPAASADPNPAEKTPGAPDAATVEKDQANAAAQNAAKPDAARQPADAVKAPASAAKDQTNAAAQNAAKPDATAQPADAAKTPAAAAQPADPLKTAAPTAKELGNDQQALAQQTQSLQAANPPAAAEAAEPLKQAADQMNAAAKRLASNAPTPAQQPEQSAIASLQKAQAAVDKKMDELKQQLGEQPDQNEQLNNAGQEIQQAQQNTADAQASLQQKKGDDAGQQLQGAAAHAANAENASKLPAQARQELAQAHQELGAGAAAEAAGNQPAAGTHAAAAAALLQQAMQQIQQAQETQGQNPDQTQGQGKTKGDKKADEWKPGQQMAKGDPPKSIHPSKIDANGNRGHVNGNSDYNGLPPRDRAAITQSGSEPAPAQYQSMVQQYMKNLADDSATPAK